MALKDSLPERYPAMIEMYAKGHANSLDVLKADFVQWPPKRLDIVNPPNFDITFHSMFKTFAGLWHCAPSFGGLFMAYMLGARFGLAYLAASTFSRMRKLRGFVHRNGDAKMYLNDYYKFMAFSQSGRRLFSHVLTHEFKHLVQKRDDQESLSSAFDERLKIGDKFSSGTSDAMLDYLAHEYEMQARMHTILVGAYHQHGAMPITRQELMAVLISQGFNVPRFVRANLLATPSGREALERFKKDETLFNRYADKTAIDQLNSVIEALDRRHVKGFWKKDIPFIYGDLLELYGDRLGHKRMGHTHNIQLREVFYKAATAHNNNKEPAKNYQTAMHSLDLMPADDATDLGCMILRGDMYQELGKALTITARSHAIGREAVNRIWGRNDLSSAQREVLQEAKLMSQFERPRVLSSRQPVSNKNTRYQDIRHMSMVS